jgi:hypothetical protein
VGIPKLDLSDKETLMAELVSAVNDSLQKTDSLTAAAAELGVQISPAERWKQEIVNSSVILQMMEIMLLTDILDELRKDKA